MTTELENDEQRDNELTEATMKAASTLLGVGRLWAAHGLGVGRSALEASAQTLRATAELLGEISDRFEGDVGEEAEEEAA